MYICAEKKAKKPDYIPALVRSSQYQSIWQRHWKEFVNQYERRFKAVYGELTQEKIEEVEKLLGCGDFQNGFQRYSCEECETNLIVPFSCKSRLCLSCYRKKLYGWSANLSHILNTKYRTTAYAYYVHNSGNGFADIVKKKLPSRRYDFDSGGGLPERNFKIREIEIS